MKRPKEMRPRRPLIFTLGSPAERWASMVVRFPLRLRIDPSIPSDNRAAAVRRKRQRDYSKVHHGHYTIDDLVTSGKPVQPLCELFGRTDSQDKDAANRGGKGTGKTTLLRILTDFIPDQDRIVVIEDTSELQIESRIFRPSNARPTRSRPTMLSTTFTSPLCTADRTGSSRFATLLIPSPRRALPRSCTADCADCAKDDCP